MRKLLFAITMLAVSLSAMAQNKVIKVWDNSTAPHSNGITTPENVFDNGTGMNNTSEATLTIYPANKFKDFGLCVVVCPGGGYEWLAIGNEGYNLAQWLADNGITAAVLKYRMPMGNYQIPLEDAEQAIKIMKGLAPGAEGYTHEKVGIAGSSAGGHLAAMTSNLANPRPDFAILYYPVITATKGIAHEGSFDNLLGKNRTEEQNKFFSLENRVTTETPPTILGLSDGDGLVPPQNSILYYSALKANKVPASLNIYPGGYHGWCTHEGFEFKSEWYATLLKWLQDLRF